MLSKYPSYIPKPEIPVYILSLFVLNDKEMKAFTTEIKFVALFLTHGNDSYRFCFEVEINVNWSGNLDADYFCGEITCYRRVGIRKRTIGGGGVISFGHRADGNIAVRRYCFHSDV